MNNEVILESANIDRNKDCILLLDAFYNNELPTTKFPADRFKDSDFYICSIKEKMSEESVLQIIKLCRNSDYVIFSVFLSAINFLLSKYLDTDEVLVGIPYEMNFDNRNQENFFPLLTKINKEKTIKDFLLINRSNLKEIYDNTDEIKNSKTIMSSGNVHKIPVIVRSNNLHGNNYQASYDEITAFTISRESESIVIHLNFDNSRYSQKSAERWLSQVMFYMNEVSESLSKNLSEVDVMTEEERGRLLYEFNNTSTELDNSRLIHTYFEDISEKQPDLTAVIYKDEKLTYGELNKKANQLASYLQKKGVQAETRVALMMNRSVEMIISIFAVLKAAGAYVPIDPLYPTDRINYILMDSEAKLLITNQEVVIEISKGYELVDLRDKAKYFSGDGSNLEINGATSKNLAYIIYTSGSTGTPKGVMVEHIALVNRLVWMQKKYPINQEDIILQKTTYCFDVSVWELIWWSMFGASVVMLEQGDEKIPEAMIEVIKECNVTCIHFVPSMFQVFLEFAKQDNNKKKLQSLKYVFASGEALNIEQVRRFNELRAFNNHMRLINLYGPTEATIDVSYFECTNKSSNQIPIGRPIDNIKLYVLNSNKQLQPIGAIGELFISGVGLARGYVNKPELTSEKFIPSPFIRGEYLYSTGDLVRMLEEGNIVYLGRKDSQVKIRGYRIELGEIETCLLRYPDISEAAVVDREIVKGQKDLCAYFVPQKEVSKDVIIEYLSNSLPDYMVPSYLIQIERLPLTGSGKLDRKSLPSPDSNRKCGKMYVEAKSEKEKILVKIWEDVLQYTKIGIDDNFFSLGGDSIKAIRLISKVNHHFGQNVTLPEFYKLLTVKNLCNRIDYAIENKDYLKEEIAVLLEREKEKLLEENRELSTQEIEDFYPISDIQLGMILHSLRNPDSGIYHDQHIYTFVEKDYDYECFKKALELLVRKNSILRTGYNITQYTEPVQIVYTNIDVDIELISMIDETRKNQEIQISEMLSIDRKAPFVIDAGNSKPPLWRMRIYKLNRSGEYCLTFSVHHSLLDGWSNASFLTELTNTYSELKSKQHVTLVKIKHNYKDFIMDQILLNNSTETDKYWKEELKDFKKLYIPLKNTSQNELGEIKYGTYQLDRNIHMKLREFSVENKVSIKTVCFAVYVYMMYMCSYDNDFVVGIVENARPVCEDGEKILGCFLNTVPVRFKIDGSETWMGFLQKVDNKLIEVKKYGRLSLPKIINSIEGISREKQQLFDNFFNFVDFHVWGNMTHISDYELQLDVHEYYKTEMQLDFTCLCSTDEFFLKVCYSDVYFDYHQIIRFFEYYHTILKNLLYNSQANASKSKVLEDISGDIKQYGYHGLKIKYAKEDLIFKCIERQALLKGESMAINCGSSVISYKELNSKANKIARELLRTGIQRKGTVAIMINRSLEMIFSMLAVLKAGMNFLPIDPKYPWKRIKYILEDCQAAAAIINVEYSDKLAAIKNVLYIEEMFSLNQSGENLDNDMELGDLAYTIYTSGSTGNPKGVQIKHSSLCNFMKGMIEVIPFNDIQSMLAITTVSFDIFFLETFVPLSIGIGITIATEEEQMDPELLGYLMKKNRIDVIQCTPSRLLTMMNNNVFVESLLNIKVTLIGGEPLPQELLLEIQRCCNSRIYNMYGPTETTIWSSVKEILSLNDITIGEPIANTQLWIVDKNNQIQPIEAFGELCISGEGLSKGYQNNESLTNERFIMHPVLADVKMYKTGDFVKRNPANGILYLGRNDNQVKIRGFRIELGEIENAITNKCNIEKCIAIVQENTASDKQLIVYYLSENVISVQEFRQILINELPDYMIPSVYVNLKEFPLMPNGKLDYSQLPAPTVDRSSLEKEIELPEDENEKAIVEMWKRVLLVDQVGVKDNFFELGGNSFLIIKVHTLLEEKYPGIISIADLFTYPSIRQLCKNILKNDDLFKDLKHLTNVSLLPEDYYISRKTSEKRNRLEFCLSKELSLLTKQIKMQHGYEIYDVFLASYLYLFNMISDVTVIWVPSIKSNGKIENIIIDFDVVANLHQYMEIIGNQSYKYDLEEPILEKLFKMRSIKHANPLFVEVDGKRFKSSLEDLSDFTLILENENNIFKFVLDFDGNKYRKEKITEFAQNYLQLAEAIIYKFGNGEN